MVRRADLSPRLWADYLAYRAKGWRVWSFRPGSRRTALEWDDDDYHWSGQTLSVPTSRWRDDPFDLVARVVPDEHDTDLVEQLGTFCDTGAFPGVLKRRAPKRNQYKFFRPAYGILEHAKDLHDYGDYARGPAYATAVEEAYKALRRAERFGDDWWSCGILVEAYLPGDEDARGADALWGIESDVDDVYRDHVARECATEAIANARVEDERRCRRSGQAHFGFFTP